MTSAFAYGNPAPLVAIALALVPPLALALGALARRLRPHSAQMAPRGVDTPTTNREFRREPQTRVEAIEALRKAEAKYRSIFENAVEGIFQTTPEGNYLSANPALARIYDYDSPEQLVASIGDIERQLYVDPGRRDEFVRIMEEQGMVSNFESQIYRRDGSVIWISECARAVRDPQGNLEYYEGTVVDIRERKQSEALFREKEAAEAASRAKSEFLANMSHELRTPLNGVIGMLDLLLDSSDSPQRKRYASIARNSADLLLSVINQVLDFSKIEAGKLELESVPFDLRSVLEESLEMLAPKATQKGLELTLDMPPELPTAVCGDSQRFRQVLVNLLGNAVKFTDRGHVRLRVRLAGETADRINVCVAVVDSGIGIPGQRLHRLFQSFSQVDASTTRQFGGTGLGLAISKRLVELMAGEIGVESTPGRGSSFWFRVPLAKQRMPARHAHLTSQALRGTRVLVVDDNATNREILFRQLSAWNVRVEMAADGASALAFMQRSCQQNEAIDLAIVDYHMPGMDGCELARQIAADESLRSVPLVMLTSLTSLSADESQGNAHVAARLTKPVRQSQLLDAILQALSTRIATESTVAQFAPRRDSNRVGLPSHDPRRERARLLLAEDNEINRLVALEVLSIAGFVCDVAHNGREAIDRLLEVPYDVILMDCQMPDLDGLEATREIRQLESEAALKARGYRVPIVALTANAIDGDQSRCLAAGMDHYLPKPLDAIQLVELLDVILNTLEIPSAERIAGHDPMAHAPRGTTSAVILHEAADAEDATGGAWRHGG